MSLQRSLQNGRQREVGFHSTVRPQVGQGTEGMADNRLTDYGPQLEMRMPFVTSQSASSFSLSPVDERVCSLNYIPSAKTARPPSFERGAR